MALGSLTGFVPFSAVARSGWRCADSFEGGGNGEEGKDGEERESGEKRSGEWDDTLVVAIVSADGSEIRRSPAHFRFAPGARRWMPGRKQGFSPGSWELGGESHSDLLKTKLPTQ